VLESKEPKLIKPSVTIDRMWVVQMADGSLTNDDY